MNNDNSNHSKSKSYLKNIIIPENMKKSIKPEIEAVEPYENKKLYPAMLPQIAVMRAEGKSFRTIASEYGVSSQTVRKFTNRKDMKKWVDEIRDELITSTLEPAKENIQALIHDYAGLDEGQTKDHAFKAMRWILDSAGITPTMAESQFTINLYQTSNVIISPMMQEVLKNFADTLKLDETDVIDVDGKLCR